MGILGPHHDYKVGDDTWIYIMGHQGNMTKGKVIAVLDLPGYAFRHYVVEVDTHVDPILEIRDCSSMRPADPKLGKITALLKKRFDLDENVAREAASDCLEIANDK